MKNAVILARGQFRTGHAKTAHGLILHGRRFRIVAVIDETCAGHDAGELMGIGMRGIPVVAGLSSVPGIHPLPSSGRKSRRSVPDPGGPGQSAQVLLAVEELAPQALPRPRHPTPDTLIIGVAPSGGHLPPAWRRDIKEAMRRRMDIVSGLHDLIGDDAGLARLAKISKVSIWDVRRPPAKLVMFKGLRSPVPVVLTCGTDASVGKRTVTAELHRAARARGIDSAYIATGQTGIMVGADAGVVIDHVPGDFMSGTVEDMVQRMVRKGKELIFVQGQASLTHLAYGPVTLGILFGARPHYVVMVHEPGRRFRPSFPDQPVNEPMEESALVRGLSGAETVGIALNCRQCTDPAAACLEYERDTGLPCVDVLKDGPDKILDAILRSLKADRRFRPAPGIKKAIGAMERSSARARAKKDRKGTTP